MKVTHEFDKSRLSEDIKNSELSFLVTDKRGSFFSQTARNNVSFYQGMCFPILNDDGWSLYKFIESIYPKNSKATEMKNNFSSIERISTCQERFSMPFESTLFYEIKKCHVPIILELDARAIYDFSSEGRTYEISNEKNILLIRYTKCSDNSLQDKKYSLFLAIKFLDRNVEVEKIEKWLPRRYSYDDSRAEPKEQYIYQALSMKIKGDSTRILFSVSDSKDDAIDTLNTASRNLRSLVKTHEKHHDAFYDFKGLKKDMPDDVYMAHLCNIKSLDDLIVLIRKHLGIYAGYYWFFHFWSRDEAISLKSLILLEKYSLVKTILMRESSRILNDGRIPNRYPHSELGSADGVGWCFLRFHELITHLEQRMELDKYITSHDLYIMKERLKKSIDLLLKHHTHDNLAISGKKESWMDTSPDDCDNRDGAVIEVQALRLNMYKLAHKLCLLTKDKDIERYEFLEKKMKEKVKDVFFLQGNLADRYKDNQLDSTIRPNVFLAHYIYPELLSKDEWISVFEKSLEKLWLGWGGLSSIDKENRLFQKNYTGENNWSYHRGDSWYFINHMAAISMYRVDRAKFMEKINSIIKASINETLYSGIIAANAEVSSASKLESKGTWQQAWSSATFIELVKEIWK